MNEIILKIILCAVILYYLIWRLVYSPKFTDLALQRFVVESLRKKSFKALEVPHNENIKVRNRSAYAHWNTHKAPDSQGMIVEFDVHPSTLPVSISSSVLIHIRDREHLDEIQKALERSDDYSPFLATDEVRKKIMHTKSGI